LAAVKVHVDRGGETVAVVELGSERTLFGRGSDCDVTLDDETVSSAHLEVARYGTAWVATDLGSRNGTLLNGQRLVGPARLADGDTLALGTCRVRVSLRAAASSVGTVPAEAPVIALTSEELAVAAALVTRLRAPGALAERPATRAEIAAATHMAERTVTRRLESLAGKLRIGPHDPRERSHRLAQRILELGLDRQRG
jgi:pSer/pThr/pTyr-binding forkhead associated (FHA) protein